MLTAIIDIWANSTCFLWQIFTLWTSIWQDYCSPLRRTITLIKNGFKLFEDSQEDRVAPSHLFVRFVTCMTTFYFHRWVSLMLRITWILLKILERGLIICFFRKTRKQPCMISINFPFFQMYKEMYIYQVRLLWMNLVCILY